MKIKVYQIVIIVILIIIAIMVGMFIKKEVYNFQYKNRIKELSVDNIEIEKKWLIDPNKVPYDLSNAKVYEIEQTYINFSPEIRVRKVNNGKQYSFTLKKNMTEDGLQRDEVDFLITEEEYSSLVKKKEGNTIYKTRYKIMDENQVVAIDIFKGDLKGLAYMEIEFANVEEANAYGTPKWIIKDVTDDIRYKNAYLAQFGNPTMENEAKVRYVSMDDIVDIMNKNENYIILDVRTIDEYNEGHIPNAICIPNETIRK